MFIHLILYSKAENCTCMLATDYIIKFTLPGYVAQIATDVLGVSTKAIKQTVTSEVEGTLYYNSNTPIKQTVLY